MRRRLMTRRRFLTSATIGGSALLLSGCDRLGSGPFSSLLAAGEWLSYHIQRLIVGSALAREYTEADMSPVFRTNGSTQPRSPEWRQHAANGFASYRLAVQGLVDRPQALSLAEFRAMPARTQITRHDCVEGWSAIGQWTGVPLAAVLERAGLQPQARYIVFHCADDFSGTNYYESIDLADAHHPQTILAYGMNGRTLPIGHGAPLRLRVERQLGYKHAKFIMRIEAVENLGGIGRGQGGYWEDVADYDWYAGI